MNSIPDWLHEIQERARPAFQAFDPKDMPFAFLFFQKDEDFFDWPYLFEFPVCNVSDSIYQSVSQDEDCPLHPIWHGREMTPARHQSVREWQCRYAQTGDY